MVIDGQALYDITINDSYNMRQIDLILYHGRRTTMARTSVTQVATCSFTPYFDIICDLSLNRRTATWNLFVNSLHPDISMHIFHTVLCTFTNVLTRRICLTIKSFFNW